MSVSIDSLGRAKDSIPRWVGAYAEGVIAAQGHPRRLGRVFHRSLVPMVLINEHRKFVDANTPALLALRLSLEELQRVAVDDLTPPDLWPVMEATWSRLLEAGCVAGPYEVASPAETRLEITYYALANALAGLHLAAFAPASWPEHELTRSLDLPDSSETPSLTARETEILELAAEGHGARQIAAELVISSSTVRTHFEHIYTKLGVRDRAAAVARAMRLGLIS